jgi:hypothetical protein
LFSYPEESSAFRKFSKFPWKELAVHGIKPNDIAHVEPRDKYK